MAQVGSLLLEFARWLKDKGYMDEVRGDFDERLAVGEFLDHMDKGEWMPTTGVETDAEPEPVDPEDVPVRIDDVVTFLEETSLNERVSMPQRIAAANALMRWFDTSIYLEVEQERLNRDYPKQVIGRPLMPGI